MSLLSSSNKAASQKQRETPMAVVEKNEEDAEDDMEYLQLGSEMCEPVLKPQPLWPHSNTVCDDERQRIRVVKTNEADHGNFLEFDLINCDASFANAVRRVLLAEVPSMAIDVMKRRLNNTAISDECLASRLGLVPLRANPSNFRYRKYARAYQHTRNETEQTPEDEDQYEFGDISEEELTSLYFCLRKKYQPANSQTNRTPPASTSSDTNPTFVVYARDLEWVPVGNQAQRLAPNDKVIADVDDVGPLHKNIILHKFAAGHEVEVYLRAIKGIGKQHAKYQPVCTAWYRMLPTWLIKEPIVNENVDKLRTLMPLHADHIFDIQDEDTKDDAATASKPSTQARKWVAGVRNARYPDNANRNFQQDAFLARAIEAGRNKRHFLFTVESVGSRPSSTLVLEALDLLIAKTRHHIRLLDTQESVAVRTTTTSDV